MSVATTANLGLGTLEPRVLADFLQRRIDPSWVTDARKEAWDQFQSMVWPNPREENWLRSDLRGFRLDKFSPGMDPDHQESVNVPARLLEGVDAAGTMRSVDGKVTARRLDPEWEKRGVLFGSLSQLCREQPQLFERLLFSLTDSSADRFAALHAALWTDGFVLYVPRNVVIDKPLHLQSVMSDGGTDISHHLIVLEEGAHATVLAESASQTEQGSGFHCGGVELLVNDRANLRYVSLQDLGRKVWKFSHQRASIGRDATIQWTVAAMGTRFAQIDQQVEMIAPGASSYVNGVLFTQDRQHLTYNTIQRHAAEHCKSDFLYKAVLQDKSRTVWRGMIKVDEGADKTDGYQRNDNLMLSDLARADSIPGLEIKADDVRCTHGSTSGRVDEELIFYARSRGFTRQEAIQMIVTGFFQQIFDRITIESVRNALGAAIARQVRQYE
jgi:Fe-S cluster assembly protein SufD